MENKENKAVESQETTVSESHEKTAEQLKKQKVRQMIVSLIGLALIAWGVFEVVCMFIDYRSNESSNDAQVAVSLTCQSTCFGIYQEDLLPRASERQEGRYPAHTRRS